MDEQEWLAERFESRRDHLRAVAHRILGSTSAADDAVQETWLRLSRSDTRDVDNLTGWLTTVISRVCLDTLRARRSRPEYAVGSHLPERMQPTDHGLSRIDPEREALVADSVGRALLLVLDTLTPAERIAFVLHDTFAVPFAEIGPVLGRSPAAAKKLAGRARQKVQAGDRAPTADLARNRPVVDAFLAAVRSGDMDLLLAVLDADVVRRADRAALPPGAAAVVRGARRVVDEARVLSQRARLAEPALIDGALGAVVAPGGQPTLALVLTIRDERITELEVVAEPARLGRLDVVVLDD